MKTQHVLSQTEVVQAVLLYCKANGTSFDPGKTNLAFAAELDAGNNIVDLSVTIQGERVEPAPDPPPATGATATLTVPGTGK